MPGNDLAPGERPCKSKVVCDASQRKLRAKEQEQHNLKTADIFAIDTKECMSSHSCDIVLRNESHASLPPSFATFDEIVSLSVVATEEIALLRGEFRGEFIIIGLLIIHG